MFNLSTYQESSVVYTGPMSTDGFSLENVKVPPKINVNEK